MIKKFLKAIEQEKYLLLICKDDDEIGYNTKCFRVEMRILPFTNKDIKRTIKDFKVINLHEYISKKTPFFNEKHKICTDGLLLKKGNR